MILLLIFTNLFIIAFILLLIAGFSDIIDGIVARKLNVASNFGAYFDACTDFSLIIIVFIGFVIIQVYPFWILILICFMFFQFLITSRQKKPVYDPVGKHLGTIHFIIIGITLIFMIIFSHWVPYLVMLIILVIFDTISLVTRFRSLYKS
ncbi:MAG: CDP-alcohol phosphatidyltransferase family protein [Candidatus Lokiarchaeota archaeon]|nr:CDP-alcohol phosphatidyltransferase family protein [Candidatus Lokiarchaeota archaeon]